MVTPIQTEELARITMKIPPFWKNNCSLWFVQLEAQFATAGITSDATKYFTVVGSLDNEILQQVSDIVLNPPLEDKYDNLKTKIKEAFEDSVETRLHKLFTSTELGDRRPSQLLREMKEHSSNLLTDQVLSTLWLQRLPAQLQAILSVINLPLDEMAKVADKIAKIHDREVSTTSVSTPSHSDDLALIKQHLEKLESKIEHLSRPTGSSSPSRRTSRSPKPLCWYHSRFGKNARKCIKPCSFQSEN